MNRVWLLSTCASIVLLGSAGLAAAETQGEFNNYCAEGLALGQKVKTDCTVNTHYNGKTYCFGNEKARSIFLKNPDESLERAQAYYSKMEKDQ
jgi:YHS domain-containing protein